jgi:riboflavin kinase/FMN adenylyltransferase
MRIHYQFDPVAPVGPAVVAISDFDGVHRMHRRLVAQAADVAALRGVLPLTALVWPHVDSRGDEQEPPRLATLAERLHRLDRLSLVETALVVPAVEPPALYLDQIGAWCDIRALVVLEDGSGARAELVDAANARGIAVESATAEDEGAQVAADAIMEQVLEGAVEPATARLGHPFTLHGEVTTGDRRGRLLGFPTANLRPAAYSVVPANGVYAALVRLPGESVASHQGVVNVGVRPTFGGEPTRLIEVHLLDVALDLYGMSIAVEFVARLRDERRFDGIDALKAQIAADARQARELLVSLDTDKQGRWDAAGRESR